MINDWHTLHITDNTGIELFKVTASPMSTMSELKNLKKHLAAAKCTPKAYKFLNIATAKIMLDGAVYGETTDVDADALLAELGL